MVKDLNEALFREKIFDYEKGDDAPLLIKENTILEFWVTWCPHCQAMIPRFEKLSEQHPDINCCRVEMEQHPDLAKLFAVDGFPTFIFINTDGKMQKWVGELPESELVELAQRAFGPAI